MQNILQSYDDYKELDHYLIENSIKRVLLVCGNSIRFLKLDSYFKGLDRIGVEVVRFSDFQPNPLYESVVEGVNLFHEKNCDSIIVVGGGSAMDVAKCIKIYSNMDSSQNYLEQVIVPNDVKLLAVPTTAGSGSEATRYAVIYYEGEKQSVTDYSCIPETVLIDASVLKTLPDYQKKSTMLDALCHSIESFWSVNSTDESKKYSSEALKMIITNMDAYLANNESGNANMLKAAHIAGKAINITQTTAGHAMSYKLTNLYGIAHGHAAALCISKLFPYMVSNIDKCIDPRGIEYLKDIFQEIAREMGCYSVCETIEKFQTILDSLKLKVPKVAIEDYEVLKRSVNIVRLMNNPVRLDDDIINSLYHQILE